MLFAKRIKPGEVVSLSPADGGEILHVSQVCMAKPSDNARTYLQVVQDGEAFNACVLQKDRVESTNVDFFLATRQKVKLKTDGGKNEVHVIGYFEPYDESEGFSEEDERMGEDESEESELEFQNEGKIEDLDDSDEDADDLVSNDDLKKRLAQKRKNLAMTFEEDDASEGESEEGEDGDDEGPEDQDEDDDFNSLAEKKSKKRKSIQPTQEASKKGKSNSVSIGSSKGSSPESEYEKALTDYLKKYGTTPLSTLGQKVKKPNGVEMKMTQFIKSRGTLFKVNGGICALAK